jgi:hypothetical protein
LWRDLGNDVNYANLYLEEVGLTAKEIDEVLKGLGETAEETAGKLRLSKEEAFRGMGEIGTIPFSELTKEQVSEGRKRGGRFWAPTEEDKRAIREYFTPGLPTGGIAMRPITTRIAEREPEAVIPLSKLGGMIGDKLVNIYVELDGKVIARAIGQPLVDEIRLRSGVHI